MMRIQRTKQIELHLLMLSVICVLVLVQALAACSSGSTPGQQLETPAPTATASSPAAATDTPGAQVPTETPSIGQATPTGGSAIALSPAGLVYRVGTGFWVVGAQGRSVHVFERTDAVISADGTQALYGDANDVWLANLANGERRNLTQSAERHESRFQWWQGRPGLVVFTSQRLEGQEKPALTEGYLTVVGVDGRGYRVLDDQTLIGGPAGLPALSPDGRTIAYSGGTTGLLFHWETGPEVFDPRQYVWLSDAPGELRIANPSWAPDGQQLAWVVDRGSQFGIAVFDLQTRTAWMGHFYDPVGMDGFPPKPVWSPDGRWLAVVAMAADPAQMGLWILGSKGEQERFLGRASNPVWSPDGDWLAFAGAVDDGGWRLWLSDTATWKLQPLSLPSDAYLARWIRP